MSRALVTGATAGIGHEFARQLASRGEDLVLVSRDEERLTFVAEQLRTTFGVSVDVLSADLTVREDLHRVAARIEAADDPIEILVNNAGFGLKDRFLDNPLADEERMALILVNAVLVLSHTAGRAMRERGRGRIVNVSSVASFMASGSYAAAKAYVRILSEAMSGELKGTGVTVTAVCPGFTRTEFHERMSLEKHPAPDFLWLDVEQVVAEGLADAEAGKPVSVPSMKYKVISSVLQYAPRGLTRRPARGKKD